MRLPWQSVLLTSLAERGAVGSAVDTDGGCCMPKEAKDTSPDGAREESVVTGSGGMPAMLVLEPTAAATLPLPPMKKKFESSVIEILEPIPTKPQEGADVGSGRIPAVGRFFQIGDATQLHGGPRFPATDTVWWVAPWVKRLATVLVLSVLTLALETTLGWIWKTLSMVARLILKSGMLPPGWASTATSILQLPWS